MRTWEIEIPVDTRTFGPSQILPREVLAFTMMGWAGWLRAHLVSFPSLVRDHHTGVVILGHHVRFPRRFRFFDGDAFTLRVGPLTAMGDGRFLTQRYELLHAGEVFACSDGVGRVVRMDPTGGLEAAPGQLPEAVLSRFLPDERSGDAPARRAVDTEPEGAELVAEGVHPFRVERRDCEVAEQWSYVEAASHAEAARASLALAPGADKRLRSGLKRPLTELDLAYARPLFVFDAAEVRTRVYARDGELIWSHRIVSSTGGGAVHGTVVERHAL
jgi:acyl-CoA thioesterase FadM